MAFDAIPPARTSALLLAASLLAVLAGGRPASAQEQKSPAAPAAPAGKPKSLLPDDLDTPPPANLPGRPQEILPGASAPTGGFAPESGPTAIELPKPPEPEKLDPLAELAGPTVQPELAGILSQATGGLGADLFSGSDGRFLVALLARLDRPLASRWGQILLQRALLTRANAPAGINPADWVAARAHALLAFGAGADAHRLVSQIAVDRYSPRLHAVALQSALATADPMALCPLSPIAKAATGSATWVLADAMCLSILGDDVGAAQMFDTLRRENKLNEFDIGLAERVASATGSGRRGANPEWGEVKGLTAWRLGMASAAGLEIPAALLDQATPSQAGWIVRLPGLSIGVRASHAPEAAATGAISSAEINRVLAAEAATLNPSDVAKSAGGQLRAANVAPEISARIDALQKLWSRSAAGSADRYGWQVATAPSAARLPASSGLASAAPEIAASLMAAGITAPASGWWRATADADRDLRARLWGMIVAATPGVPVEASLFDRWADDVPAHRADLLAAGLAGLGRGDVGRKFPLIENDWTRAMDRAVASRHAGEAMLLAASALRGSWAEVPPDYLRRIAAALVILGYKSEAALIVAEAANRG